MKIFFKNTLLIFAFLLVLSCSRNGNEPDYNNPSLQVSIDRFEVDLFNSDFEHFADSVPFFKKKYGTFYDIFNHKIINIGSPNNPVYGEYLKGFVTDYTINEVYKEIKVQFPDLKAEEDELSKGFSMFHFYFPQIAVPRFYTFISGFNQSIVTSDSLIAIGLDKYLGPECFFYGKLSLPHYIRFLMDKKRITNDCLRSWLITNYEMKGDNNLLSNMLYQGKIAYSLKMMQPEADDSIVYGISAQKLKWCEQNEGKMWIYLVEYKKLYETDQLSISKFINEGPFTKEFSSESPAKAAVWLGSRIVADYMKNDKGVSLDSLMRYNDYQEILRKSKYRP